MGRCDASGFKGLIVKAIVVILGSWKMSNMVARFVSSFSVGRLVLLPSLLLIAGQAAAGPLQLTTFAAVEAEVDAIDIIIDDAIPNSGPVNNQPIQNPVSSSAFTDIGIGLVSTGQVGDWTSSQVTSDFYANGTATGPVGETIAPDFEWNFVNPSAPSFDATVEKIGFHFGSTNANTVRVEFYDKDDVFMDALTLGAVTQTSNVAVEVKPGETVSIGRVRFFSLIPGDTYVVGSFTLDPLTTTDIVISGFVADQPVPLPATLLLMMTGLLVLSRQKCNTNESALSRQALV